MTVLLNVFDLFLGILGFMFGLNSGHFSHKIMDVGSVSVCITSVTASSNEM